jgi:hypothetical protein
MATTMTRARSALVAGLAALLAAALAIPIWTRPVEAVSVADFAPPMPAAEAQARVAQAQAAEAAALAAQARRLNATSPELLPKIQKVFFGQSAHHLSDRVGFLTFWRENGGVMIFGYPISEEIVEGGRIVQYFERARFEYHPEALGTPEQVQLGLVGREATAGRAFPPGAPDAGEEYFPETGHTLSGKFRYFWHKRGGLRVFGYPISEPMDEVNPLDGQMRRVQYFERARFEYRPEALDGFYQQMALANGLNLLGLHEIELGDVGRQAAQQRGYQFGRGHELPGAPDWSSLVWPRRIEVNLSTQWLTAYEGDVPVFSAPVATGKDGFNTPTGSYAIYSRTPMETMVGSSGGETWYVPDIPWVQYVVGGVALHGTYWHDRWGTGVRMSHGCINLNIDDAEWLYNWADIGTPVDIHY